MRLMYDEFKAKGIEISFPQYGLSDTFSPSYARDQYFIRYNQLAAQGKPIPEGLVERFRELGIPDLTVINADNIRDYLMEQEIWMEFLDSAIHETDELFASVSPNVCEKILSLSIRLPIRFLWLEFYIPSNVIPDPDPFEHISRVGFSMHEERIKHRSGEEEIVIQFHMWISERNGGPFVEPIWHWVFVVDERGSISETNFMRGGEPCGILDEGGMDDDQYFYWSRLVLVPLYALAFMNCHNVELIDNEPTPLTKKQKKRGDPERVSYKTIKVLPIRKVYNEAEADEEPESGLMPLHICRGHFKDFRNGPGLFGKYREIFWWEQHVRGKAENGRVIKDYEVLAPESA